MVPKKTLLGSSLTLTIAAIAVLDVSVYARPPKPSPISVSATYRDAGTDALQGGGPHVSTLAADGSRLTVPGPLCYYETTPFVDEGECLEGNLADGFSMCGGGEIVVTPALESFLDMSIGESQPADATARIVGDDNFRYFVRFKPTDTLVSDPNCSSQVTITRIDSTHWEVESFGDDVARVLTNKIRGGGGYTNRGHYLASFQISVSQP